jgi:hypothetical protein
MRRFISEDGLRSFEGWLEYKAIDAAALTQDQLSICKETYDGDRERASSQKKIGRIKLPCCQGNFDTRFRSLCAQDRAVRR